MYSSQAGTQFRFGRRRPLPTRLIAVAVGVGVFTALWFLVSQDTLFWLLLPAVAVLAWVATYGWRWAVAALHVQLHRLELFQTEVNDEHFARH